MIKIDENGVEIKFTGNLSNFLTEITMFLRTVRESLSKITGEKLADELLGQAVRLSKMSENELEKTAAELKEKAEKLFGGGDTSHGSVKEDKESE